MKHDTFKLELVLERTQQLERGVSDEKERKNTLHVDFFKGGAVFGLKYIFKENVPHSGWVRVW